jgi:uncharacterized protein (TIGR04255 family)
MVKYNNPPIIESVCEIKFTEDTPWDMTVPGLIFEGIRERYPEKGQRTTQEISISALDKDKGKSLPQLKRQDFAIFLTDDKRSQILVGPRTLLVSRLKPYSTWEDFKSQIGYAFEKLSGKVELKEIQRIGLRYINKIEIKTEDGSVNLDKFFEFRPFCGPQLPQLHGNFIVGCVFPFSQERDLCRVELTSAVSEREDSMAFILSIDYFLNIPRSVPVGETMNWVENAYSEVKKIFEGCISPPLREKLQEVNE